jgi:hypothetical protein
MRLVVTVLMVVGAVLALAVAFFFVVAMALSGESGSVDLPPVLILWFAAVPIAVLSAAISRRHTRTAGWLALAATLIGFLGTAVPEEEDGQLIMALIWCPIALPLVVAACLALFTGPKTDGGDLTSASS